MVKSIINLRKSQHSYFCECHEHCDRATDWTILNSIKLTTYYLIIWFLRCLTLVQSVAPRQICAEIICLHVDLLALGSFMHANGRWKTLQMFSFTDFRDVVSELALHAESKMIIFTSGRCCKVSLNFFGTFRIVMHTAGKEAEINDWHPPKLKGFV